MREAEFHEFLEQSTGRRIDLRINRNVRSLVSTTTRPGSRVLKISVHRMFLDAPRRVRLALADFVVKPTLENRKALREFIAHNGDAIGQSRADRESPGISRGEHHDLGAMARRINRRFFKGSLDFRIEWGRYPTVRPRSYSQITLGTCLAHRGLIRIHPVLDSARVPAFYLEYVVYHEMLHLAVPPRLAADGRLLHHGRDFTELERRFPRYDEACAWQDRQLRTLLDSWCRPRRSTRSRTRSSR